MHLTAIFIPLTSNVLTESPKCTVLFVTKGKGTDMKAEVKISDDVLETYAMIYTNRMSEEVNRIVEGIIFQALQKNISTSFHETANS